MDAQVDVQVSEPAGWVPLSQGRALPIRFWARVDDPAVPYMILLEVTVLRGSAAVRQLVVHQRDDSYPPGPPVASLRSVNTRSILRQALDAAARRRTDLDDGMFTVEGIEGQAWKGPATSARHPDSDRLDVVAQAYRAAKAEGRPVRQAVMDACGVEQSQAQRLIRAAREAGRLEPRLVPTAVISPALHRPPDGGLRIFGGPQQPVVAAIVTSPRGVLIGRRNDRTPPWTFIAGEQEPGEQAEDTAIREVKEETGLEVRTGEEIGRRVHPATGRTMVYVAARPVRGTRIYVGDEAELAEVKWVSLAEADELLPGMYEPVRTYLAGEIGEEG